MTGARGGSISYRGYRAASRADRAAFKASDEADGQRSVEGPSERSHSLLKVETVQTKTPLSLEDGSVSV